MFSLRTVLRLDALASGSLGVLLLVLFSPAEELGLPVALSLTVGALLLVWAGFVAWVAADPRPSYVREVIALNAVYVLGSVVLAVSGWVDLTGLGVAFVLLQALAVLLFTIGQTVAIRGADRTAVPA